MNLTELTDSKCSFVCVNYINYMNINFISQKQNSLYEYTVQVGPYLFISEPIEANVI